MMMMMMMRRRRRRRRRGRGMDACEGTPFSVPLALRSPLVPVI